MRWVAFQVVLLGVLAAVPGSTIRLSPLSIITMSVGIALIGSSAVALGRSLSPFPTPSRNGRLTGSGPYEYIRHPMYVGVVLCAVAFAIATDSPSRVGLTIVLAIFFDFKARFEERALETRTLIT